MAASFTSLSAQAEQAAPKEVTLQVGELERTAIVCAPVEASMSASPSGEWTEYTCKRKATFNPKNAVPAEFKGRYRPVSGPRPWQKNTLENFLVERYCLYAIRRGKLVRAHIHHLPWPLQDAEAEIEVNTMMSTAGIELPKSKRLLHFSRFLEVLIWWPEVIGKGQLGK